MTLATNSVPPRNDSLFNPQDLAPKGHSNRDVSSAPPPPLKLLSQLDLVNLEIPPRASLLGEWLTERHPCMVYAQTGRGKSLFAMSVAMAVAGGGSVFGWQTEAASKVLYIDAEMDVADIKDRDMLLKTAVEGVNEEILGENLIVLSRHYQSVDAPFPDLADDDGRRVLMGLVDELTPKLVILDNLSTLAEIKDENDAASFTPVLRTLWELRQKGCAVLLIHHTGKQEGKYRGSSKLAATFESILQLAPNPDLVSGETGFTIKVDKFRGCQQPKPLKVKLETNDETGGGWWTIDSLQQREFQELVKLVRSREFCYAKDISLTTGVSTGEISKRKRAVISTGLITVEEWNQCFQDARDIKNNEEF